MPAKSTFQRLAAPPQSTITAIYVSNSGRVRADAGAPAAQQLYAFLLECLDGLPASWSQGDAPAPAPAAWQNADLEIELGDLGIWQAINAGLRDREPSIEDYPRPEAQEGDELGDGLYNSGRDYLEQIDAYKQFQGKEAQS